MLAHVSRRQFLATTGATVLAGGVWSELAAQESNSPNEKLNIGIIGAGNRGAANTHGVAGENIAALCDVDERTLARAREQYPQAAPYHDWRRLVENRSLDAVVISTTDHTHAPCAIAAMRSGKHVYCEKPVAHTVEEARLVRNVFRTVKLATQHGTQIHAEDNYRRVVELVQAGAIGPIREAHVWCGRTSANSKRPIDTPPVPDYLHWDLWLGPAPQRNYHPIYMPGNLTWNRWWEYGNGVLGDMGSHLIDLPWWALELEYLSSVEVDGPEADPDTNPAWMIATWQHPATSKRPAVKVVWYHGGRKPEPPPGYDLGGWGNGILFVGDDGWLVADYGRRVLLPEEKYRDFKPPEPTIPRSLGHYREWIAAAKTGSPTTCDFEYAGLLIEHNLLGNVAHRVGQRLEWDAKNLKATNCPDAERFIKKEYRKGWEIEA